MSFSVSLAQTLSDFLQHHYFYELDFAYNLELKPIYFDFNHRTSAGQDCAVVGILDGYQHLAPTQPLQASFFDLLLALRAAQEQGEILTR